MEIFCGDGVVKILSKKYIQRGGVYQIQNIVNKRIYIGASTNLFRRTRSHRNRLNDNNHANKYLQKDWNKYGGDSFKINIILLCDGDKEILNLYEDLCFKLYRSENKEFGYNIKYRHSKKMKIQLGLLRLGCKHTEDTKKIISAFHKGNKYNIGRKLTDECKRKKSEKMKGRTFSDETKRKMSIARKKWWENRCTQ